MNAIWRGRPAPGAPGALAPAGAVLVGTLLVGIGLAGCGGMPPPKAVVHRHPASVIAMELPLTGPESAVGLQIEHGAELALAQPNSGEQSSGHVTLDVRDDAGDPARVGPVVSALLAARPAVVVTPPDPALAAIAVPLLRRAGVPVVGLTAGGTAYSGNASVTWTDQQLAALDAQEVVSVLHAPAATVITDGVPEHTALASALQALLSQSQLPVTVTSWSPGESATQVASSVASFKGTLVLMTTSAEAGGLTSALSVARFGGTCVVGAVDVVDGYASAAGSSAPDCAVAGLPPLNLVPSATSFSSDFGALYGGVAPGPWAALGADAVAVALSALHQVGTTDAVPVTDSLEITSGLSGATGTISVNATSGERLELPLAMLHYSASGVTSIDQPWAAFAGWPPAPGK